ncbi:uncharacterized protein LOC110986935 [Acanthaster planci]|uniref:Uncharacterized protein LOC110986935 n=1 Tax=Acanthaster planci TaxID=133434 RepID=A0A8B7ZIX9_ACAPL|nr:uncharacterized protein LOC110986935 [Acanthaster planci]
MQLAQESMLCLLCCVVSLARGAFGETSLESPKFCFSNIKDELCTEEDCTRTSEQPCYHGTCSDTGACVCLPCWRGPLCNEAGNEHAPVFTQHSYEEYISPDEPKEYPFMYLRATDKDETTCAASKTNCPCSEVRYSLDDEDRSGKSPTFAIDSKTGGVSVAAQATLTPNSKHRLKVYARNAADDGVYGTAPVVIVVSDVLLRGSEQTVKLRRLQSMPEISVLDSNHTLDISFVPATEFAGVGALTVGSRVDCVLTIDIPESMMVQGVSVEIFTDDENNTLSVLCPPTVNQGAELEITDSIQPKTSGVQQKENPFWLDTAIYSFGNVTNLNTSTSANASKIIITFSITLKEDMALANDERYWVSAGVEYNGGEKLWIGQIGFLIDQVPQYAADTNLTISGVAVFHKREVEVFSVDLNVYRSVANLTVRATAHTNIKEHLLICELQLCNTGTGFCLDVNKDLATFQVDVVTQNAYESVFGFGHIINGGEANSTADSRIAMDVVAYLRDNSGLAAESSSTLEASANDGVQDLTDTVSFTVKAGRSYITPTKVVNVNVSIVGGDTELIPGECAKVRVSIIIPYSTSVSPVSVKLAVNAKFQIAAVRVNHIGNDISCLIQRRDDIEKAVVYEAGPAATIDLKGVANTGGEGTTDDVNNVIGVDFVVKSTVTDLGAHGNSHTINVKFNHAGKLEQTYNSLSVTTTTNPASITYPTVPAGDPNPFSSTFDLKDASDPPEIAPGEFIVLAIRLVIQPDAQYRFGVTGLVNTTGVTTLDMRVISVGSNIAGGLLVDPVATYTSWEGGSDRDYAELDLGMVYNFARPGSPTTDDDALVIQLIVRVSEDVPDSTVPVAASVLVGATRLWVSEGNITVATSVAKAPILTTNNTLSPAPTYSTEVTAGSETKVLHTLVIPANISSKYVVNYTTSVAWLQVTSINVTSVGLNLLCTQEGLLSPIFGNSDSETYAVVDLGYVCNPPIGNATEENSKLVLELTVSTMNSSEVEIGLTAALSANVEVSNALGNSERETQAMFFQVELPKSTFKLCCPESAHFMHPGEIERCNITMTILDDSLTVLLELDTPFNDTASMTLSNVEVGTGGYNLVFEAPDVVLTSTGNTSQNNVAKLDFGRITNTGAHTAEAGNLEDGDNDIVVYIDVQMADGEQNVNASYHALGSGVSVSSGAVVWVAYYKLAVLRDGTEKPALNVSFNHNGTAQTYSLGDKVWYKMEVSHAIDSNAEAVNVKGHVFLPPYIQFDSMALNLELSDKLQGVSHWNDNTGFYFTVPRMFFSDRLALTLETSIKTNYRYKLTKNWKGTTPIEVIYFMTNYDTNFYTDGQYFSEPMGYTTFDFTVPYPDIPGQTLSPSCGNPQALGMQDGTIQDCQITASFSPEPNAAAQHARLNGASAWKTLARAGPFLYDRWIKIDLGKKAYLTGVQTQGGSSAAANGDIGEFEILYSLDDTLYKAATPSDNKAFDHQRDSPANHDTVVTHTLMVPVEARYVILNLTAYDYRSQSQWYNALRLELMGCVSGQAAADTCPTPATNQVGDMYERGFLVDTNSDTLFVCDTVTHGKSGVRKEIQASVYAFLWKKPDMQCFMMIYAEKQWTGLDPRLRNIIGFLPSTGRLYGILGNSPDSYAASNKPYSNWYLIERSTYDTAAASDDFVTSIAVPFASETGFSYSESDNYATSKYAISEWKATMNGIYKGAEKVLDWNECCQPTCAASGGPDDCS